MAINAAQFVRISEFHKHNLNILLEQNIDLPEAPGILAAMVYLQHSINKASTLLPSTKEDESGEKGSPDPTGE